jgi:hypothetical protein
LEASSAKASSLTSVRSPTFNPSRV